MRYIKLKKLFLLGIFCVISGLFPLAQADDVNSWGGDSGKIDAGKAAEQRAAEARRKAKKQKAAEERKAADEINAVETQAQSGKKAAE